MNKLKWCEKVQQFFFNGLRPILRFRLVSDTVAKHIVKIGQLPVGTMVLCVFTMQTPTKIPRNLAGEFCTRILFIPHITFDGFFVVANLLFDFECIRNSYLLSALKYYYFDQRIETKQKIWSFAPKISPIYPK